eukprot:12425436-Alexandrium_andersonii.AAC.1
MADDGSSRSEQALEALRQRESSPAPRYGAARASGATLSRTAAAPHSPRTRLRASSPGRRQPVHLGTSDAAFEGPARSGR